VNPIRFNRIGCRSSPDGNLVVTASSDQTARIWDVATGAQIGNPMKHQQIVVSATFSSDGTRVCHLTRLRGFGMRHRRTDRLYIAAHASLQWSRDGTRVFAVSDDNTARVWAAPPVAPNIIATACKMLGENHDTAGLTARYGIEIKEPIWTSDAPAPDRSLSVSVAGTADAQSDPLPSWNEGAVKDAVLKFVRATTDASNPDFVPLEERIATFDQDGTLWVEHPIYTQVVYCFDRVPEVVKAKPDLANEEPFKTVLSGNREAMAKLSMDDLLTIVGATLTGMDVVAYRNEVVTWMGAARDQRWNRPYTDLVYLPQIELLKYLRANGYRTYIVTGGGQDFVRAYSNRTYGIPPEQVVGTAGAVRYMSTRRTGSRC
jgi:hypothetical protein